MLMRRFLYNAILLGLMVASSTAAIAVLPDTRSAYLKVLDKTEILAVTPPPRVILVGGSNLLFSHDSSLLQKALGRPFVNMGLNAGIGLRFMTEEIKPYLNPGDIVLVIPEYLQFFESFVNGDQNLWEYLDNHPRKSKLIKSFRQKVTLLKELPVFISRKFRRLTAHVDKATAFGVYYSGRFDITGDMVGIDGPPSPSLSKLPLFNEGVGPRSFNPEAIDVLNELNDYAAQKQVRVFLLFPPISQFHYEQNRKLIDYVYQRLKKELRIPILSSPQDNTYPLSDFFDTVYHLNSQGKSKRTAALLSILRRALPPPKYPVNSLSGNGF